VSLDSEAVTARSQTIPLSFTAEPFC